MLIQLVVVVETFTAEATQGVAFEARLVSGAWLIVAASHVLLQFLVGKELVFMSEDLFVTGAKVAHSLTVH